MFYVDDYYRLFESKFKKIKKVMFKKIDYFSLWKLFGDIIIFLLEEVSEFLWCGYFGNLCLDCLNYI